jgi:hypothetical protein
LQTLSALAKYLSLGGLVLMVVSMTLLVAPVMQHRLVERGDAPQRLLRTTTRFATASLAPLALSLAVATYVVIGRRYGVTAGFAAGLCMGTACAFFWFGIEAFIGISEGAGQMKQTSTPLKTKVEQLLTEARVIIPGGQALFGFQFIAMLTPGFDKLPPNSQLVHTAALCFTALNVIVLMAPAALHRLSFGGEDSEAFLRLVKHGLGSALLITAPMLLALAVAAELYVVFDKVLTDSISALIAGLGGWLVMTAFWYVIPLRLKSHPAPVSVHDEGGGQPSGKPSLVK